SERGNRETHKFQWDCATGVAYMNGTAQGWRVTRVLQAFDLSDPAHPKHIRDFGLVGYEPSATGPYPEPQVAGLHQPFVVGVVSLVLFVAYERRHHDALVPMHLFRSRTFSVANLNRCIGTSASWCRRS